MLGVALSRMLWSWWGEYVRDMTLYVPYRPLPYTPSCYPHACYTLWFRVISGEKRIQYSRDHRTSPFDVGTVHLPMEYE